jgi:N,N'-diacetyllegionaminate synthase
MKLKKKTYIIAEVGNNHEGNFEVAKKLVVLAAKAGADAVKFQTFKAQNFIIKKDKKRFNLLKKFELKYKQFIILKNLAHKNKIDFISTPLDLESADFLLKNTDAIKIASGDNNFFPLIEKVLVSKKPVIISTGMTDSKDLKYLIKIIENKIGKKRTKNKISLLHCVSSYPVDNEYANLKSISYMLRNFYVDIGYSDHTIGNDACLASVALGAKIIEKHFTLDKHYSSFRDHALSADFFDFKNLVKSIRIIEKQLGKDNKKIAKPEKKILKIFRRGVYAKKNIRQGEKVNLKNSTFLRPSNSRDFLHIIKIFGKKIRKQKKYNQIIS